MDLGAVELVADRQHTQSRLPSYRGVDLLTLPMQIGAVSPVKEHGHGQEFPALKTDDTSAPASPLKATTSFHDRARSTTGIALTVTNPQPASTEQEQEQERPPPRTSPRDIAISSSSSSLPAVLLPPPSDQRPLPAQTEPPPIPDSIPRNQNSNIPTKTEPKHPGPYRRHGLESAGRPPKAMITQRSYSFKTESSQNSQTTDWVAQQQSISLSPTTVEAQPHPPPQNPPSRSAKEQESACPPLIKPIRGFKPSSRRSVEMASHRISVDPDSTLRAYGGGYNSNSPRITYHHEIDEQHSDDSDLFLRAAKEEELSRQTSNSRGTMNISDSRKSRAGDRGSLPPPSTQLHLSTSRRRGSQQEMSHRNRSVEERQESVAQALTYRPSKNRPAALEDVNRARYMNFRSNPTTPRTRDSGEISPESPGNYIGRRPSVPDTNPPPRSYRQSNLSYPTPRVYNSSPLVSHATETHEAPETTRAAEGTESTVSTTAPSTVWDELEDLKSRIHRLELTGKLPPTSGAAVSRASNDRPPTATTTVTTISSSPKRGRGNSSSPAEPATHQPAPSLAPAPVLAPASPETHPLLRAALAKSKSLLNEELYKALEATASDALMIASMMGTSGQPGPISSSQSTIGGVPSVTDRQVRRKVDSMCRSLTELCLALSEGKNEAPAPLLKEKTPQPSARDTDVRPSIESDASPRRQAVTDLARVKTSPRALSRLEQRRSSLLATSSLPSPRYVPSEGTTPTQTSMAGRRSSMLLRPQRVRTEEAEEEEGPNRFRAPSRANTDVGHLRNAPREYTSRQPLPERPTVVQSALPVRRHYTSTSLNKNPLPTPPISMSGGRRFLDRLTPDRDPSSAVARYNEERQRKGSIGSAFPLGKTGSLTRRTRGASVAES